MKALGFPTWLKALEQYWMRFSSIDIDQFTEKPKYIGGRKLRQKLLPAVQARYLEWRNLLINWRRKLAEDIAV